jgi:hypothetical protein
MIGVCEYDRVCGEGGGGGGGYGRRCHQGVCVFVLADF